MPNRLPLSPDTLAIHVLDSSVPSKFSPKDTIGTIYDQLMVEQWLVLPNDERYYGACNPDISGYVHLSLCCHHRSICSSTIAIMKRRTIRTRSEGANPIERTWVWNVIATCFGSLFLGTCAIIRFASSWDSRRYCVIRSSVCLSLCRALAIVIDSFGDAIFGSGGVSALILDCG